MTTTTQLAEQLGADHADVLALVDQLVGLIGTESVIEQEGKHQVWLTDGAVEDITDQLRLTITEDGIEDAASWHLGVINKINQLEDEAHYQAVFEEYSILMASLAKTLTQCFQDAGWEIVQSPTLPTGAETELSGRVLERAWNIWIDHNRSAFEKLVDDVDAAIESET